MDPPVTPRLLSLSLTFPPGTPCLRRHSATTGCVYPAEPQQPTTGQSKEKLCSSHVTQTQGQELPCSGGDKC